MFESDFFRIWRDFQGKAQEDELPMCPIAAEFGRKVEETILIPLGTQPSLGQLAQGKYLLQEWYQQWRKSIPAGHLRSAAGHRCVDDLYHFFYDALHLRELTRRPAINLVLEYDELTRAPAAAQEAAAPPLEIAGILLGELEDVDGYQGGTNG